MNLRKSGLVTLMLAVSLSACGTSAEPSDTTFASPSVEAQWDTSFQNIDDLASASSVVVRGVVAPNPVVGYAAKDGVGDNETMATDFTVDIREIIAGKVDGSDTKVVVHLMGTAEKPFFSESDSAFLDPGKEYVLYLIPFEYEDHQPTGKYTITGGVGAFAVQGGTLRRTTTRDPLPSTLPEAQVKQSSVRNVGKAVKR